MGPGTWSRTLFSDTGELGVSLESMSLTLGTKFHLDPTSWVRAPCISLGQTYPLSPQTTGHTTSRQKMNMSVRRE